MSAGQRTPSSNVVLRVPGPAPSRSQHGVVLAQPIQVRPVAVTGVPAQTAQVHPQHEASRLSYWYRVKIINQVRKGDSVVRDMRKFHGKFGSVVEMKMKLLEEFEDLIPPTLSFSVGFYDGKQSTKRWVCTAEDLSAMYRAHTDHPEKEIRLWCDGRRTEEEDECNETLRNPKRKKTSQTPLTRREEKESQIDELVAELRENNTTHELSEPQYRLWARMIISGVHTSKEVPPQIPMITGVSGKRRKKSLEQDEMIVGTAAAIVKAVNNVSNTQIVHSPQPQSSSPMTSQQGQSAVMGAVGVSPGKAVDIRGKSLNQLCTLKQLFEDGILSQGEFDEQKEIILNGLRKL